MAVAIRMKRMGRKNRAYYRICATDKRSPRDGREIEVRGHDHPRATQAAAIDNRGVVQLVGNDDVPWPRERGKEPDVRGVAGREQERGIEADPVGKRAFERLVRRVLTAHEPRSSCAPGERRIRRLVERRRVTEVIVRAEIDCSLDG